MHDSILRFYKFICLAACFILFASNLSFAQFKLTVQFSDMGVNMGQKFELRVIDQAKNNEVGRTKLEQITSAAFGIELYVLLQDHNYVIEFYADVNGSGAYETTDDSWRVQLPNVQSDTLLSFSRNMDFTEIAWPPLIDFKYYTAIWTGTRTNFTFSSGGSFEIKIDLAIEDMHIEGLITATDAFGVSGTTILEFEGEFFQEADSAVIIPKAGSDWTGTLFWANSEISGAFTFTPFNAKVSLSGTLGRTQAIVKYAIDVFSANGIIVALEDSVITSIRQDSLALIALYDSTDGDNWTNNDNWKSAPVSQWHGVTVANNRVTSLQLGGNNLNGTIPRAMGDLTELTLLQLENNSLQGNIPAEIGNLTNLESLRLEQNSLSGEIPLTIGNLDNLSILRLFSNDLTGEIPTSIENLSHLTQLYLFDNQLNGIIPAGLWNLVNLIELRLNANGLSGTLPAEIGNLTLLKRLVLSNNNFSGMLPPEIAMTKLFDLSLSDNNFEGILPEELTSLTTMIFLNISLNNFSGEVPEGISAFSQLRQCWVQNNSFHNFPDMSGVSSLTDLRMQDNSFTFEDIEPNIGVATFRYAPQDSVGENQDTTVMVNSAFSLAVMVGGSANLYQWLKDGTEISGATDSVFTVITATVDDAGVYTCRITNTIATALTLYSRTIRVQVNNTTSVADEVTPQRFNLYANYPNPFNPETTIRYDVANTSHVTIEIFNLLGQKISALVDAQKPAGSYSISWNGRTEKGFEAPSGTYLYRIKAGQFEQSRKLVLLR